MNSLPKGIPSLPQVKKLIKGAPTYQSKTQRNLNNLIRRTSLPKGVVSVKEAKKQAKSMTIKNLQAALNKTQFGGKRRTRKSKRRPLY